MKMDMIGGSTQITNRSSQVYAQNQTKKIKSNQPKEATMGALMKLIDTILIIFFLIIAIAAPLLDAQTCLPSNIFPDILVHLKTWYTHEYGDYLVSEKPHFFVGLIWVELLFAWPLSIASIYGIAAGKSWVHTTCLMYGVSTLTAMALFSPLFLFFFFFFFFHFWLVEYGLESGLFSVNLGKR
ncbi:putative EXPERA domain-containing protein [Helianthus annuus]|nr:putative EXPERA domain-containing protein [Helianthus annuus]KAJ0447866.1 putative EXPERA domain-containing protein [Helianthus annuus]KAJ0632759.1 putative EXPERA domain-containing protein [Helianthus annuus]KAJ0826703.1 putative EXPERA domain-containing protein [Helianthus annuus]